MKKMGWHHSWVLDPDNGILKIWGNTLTKPKVGEYGILPVCKSTPKSFCKSKTNNKHII